MARGRERDRRKERYWRRVLRQWLRSGQGVRAYCWEHGLSEACFFAWRRTIEERDQGAERPRPGPRPGLPRFVSVTVTASASPLEVVLADGRVVRVPAGFDAATLRQLLAVLEEAPPC